MMKKNRLLKVATLLLSMLLFSFFSFGQALKIRGTVKDEKGATLPSVSIKIKGTTKGTVTDYNGKYTIDVPSSKAVLVFSFVGYRWFDLVRTQTWSTIAASYQICGTANGDHTPVTITRSIPANLYLRPIPQGQIDGMDMSTADKAAYQNPGY